MGFSGQGSSGPRGSCQGLSFVLLPWENQSRIWNWSQAAARRLRVVAGVKVLRVRSSVETTRGLGVIRVEAGSWRLSAMGTLRPKRAPAEPIKGHLRSLKVPSAVREVWTLGWGGVGGVLGAGDSVSKRLAARSLLRTPMRTTSPIGVGRVLQPCFWSIPVHRSLNAEASLPFMDGAERTLYAA